MLCEEELFTGELRAIALLREMRGVDMEQRMQLSVADVNRCACSRRSRLDGCVDPAPRLRKRISRQADAARPEQGSVRMQLLPIQHRTPDPQFQHLSVLPLLQPDL